MDNTKHYSFTILSLFATTALSLCIWSLYATNSFTLLSRRCPSPNPTKTLGFLGEDELGAALSRASMANKTVIIAMINKAYADQMDNLEAESTMLDVFLDGFWLGENTGALVDHLVLVAVDQTAYERCRFLKLNCLRIETEGVDFRDEKLYMSPDFINMMWRRTWLLLEVLKRGYNFIFTDTDVLWLRNPFTKLSNNQTEDLQISTDYFNGNSWSENNPINTGFYFVNSNNKTIALFQEWYASKNIYVGIKEQDVLLRLLRRGIVSRLRLSVRFLDTLHFSGFCQDSKDVRVVATIHANCCRSIGAKVVDLRNVLRDWKRFKKIDAENATEMANFRWSRHWGCSGSWKVKSSNITGML